MPRGAWIALGALLVALAWPALGPPGLAAATGGTIVLGGLAGLTRERGGAPGAPHERGRVRFASVGALAVGELALVARLAFGGLAFPTTSVASLPPGHGPWLGVVVAMGTPGDGVQRTTVRLEDAAGLTVAATLPRYPPLALGDRIRFEGALRVPPADGYGTYLARIGVSATVQSAAVTVVPSGDTTVEALQTVREGADDALARVLPEPEAGLASGILVGLRGRVDRQLAGAFTAAGVSHVVAISGWNIAIVAALVAAMLGRLGRRPRAVVTLGAIVAYTVVVGASPSVLRAALMASVVLLARESGRGARAAAALGWAATLMLLADPAVATDAGFQLSAAATAGLIVWSRALTARLTALGRHLPGPLAGRELPGWLAETLGVSLAAQAATLPIILLDFGRVSLVSPLANLLVVPLVPAVMAGGALALLAGWLAAFAPLPAALVAALAFPGWLLLALLCGLVGAAAAVPFASLTLGPPLDIVAATLAAAAIGAVTAPGRRLRLAVGRVRPRGGHGRLPRARGCWGVAGTATDGSRRRGRSRSREPRPRHGRLLLSAAVVAVAAVVLVAAARPDGRLRVVVLGVGQGDAILVEGGRGSRLLVDGGPDPDRLLLALDAHIPAWDRRLDLVVLTHPHEDHVGGLPGLLDRYRVGRVFEPGMPGTGPAYQAWLESLAARGLTSERLGAGDALQLDGCLLKVLWPRRGSVPSTSSDEGRTVNDVSIVLLGELGAQRFLLTGDAEDDVDPVLLEAGLPPVALLKVAHHGSATSSSAALLDAVRPEVAVVSVGTGNRYGHPAAPTLARLDASAGRVLRTDRDGTVEAVLDGSRITLSVGNARPAPSRRADAARTPTSSVGRGERRVGGLTAMTLLYHRADEHSRARRGRRPPAVPPSSSLAPASLAGRRGGGRLAGGLLPGAGHRGRSPPCGGGRPAPRRGQAAARMARYGATAPGAPRGAR